MAVRFLHVVAAAVLLTVPGCKSRRTPSRDASPPAPHITKNKSNLVDWKTACALGKALGMPTGYSFPTPVPTDERNSLGSTWRCVSMPTQSGVLFHAWGDNLDGANALQLSGRLDTMKPEVYRRHMLEIADKLTQKVVGEHVPAVLRQALLTGGTKTVGLPGWRLAFVTRADKQHYEYTINSD